MTRAPSSSKITAEKAAHLNVLDVFEQAVTMVKINVAVLQYAVWTLAARWLRSHMVLIPPRQPIAIVERGIT